MIPTSALRRYVWLGLWSALLSARVCHGQPLETVGRPVPWQAFAQGEYIGPARSQHVPEYQLRVDDELEFVYRFTSEELGREYQLDVGDVIRVESAIDAALTREVTVQPDGTIDLLYLGPVRVVRRTVSETIKDLNQRYTKFYKVTDINVTRVKTQARLEGLRAAVDSRSFSGGQARRVRVTPAGTLSLPAIGVVPAQGLTLDELRREVQARYQESFAGVEVTPILAQRAPRYIFVVGQVCRPGRYELLGPTSAMQSLALAGGWTDGADLRQVALFRRTDDWSLLATKLDIRGALAGHCPSPADEIWLRDSDIVVVPKTSHHGYGDVWTHLFGHGSRDCGVGGCSTIAGVSGE
ncbi:MAG: polysaccharide biosynthesis/export family protein [Planctomycetaceae bacterium]|nr:polysaccharide biosynthesis/export family protein [Planctomycetaceae bacterium]